MELQIKKTTGLKNELLLIMPRNEVDDVLFHIANREQFMQLPGLLRHVAKQDQNERRRVNELKIPVEQHLMHLSQDGYELLDGGGRPKRRLVTIGCRNTGNNHGFVAWQTDQNPSFFSIKGDPLNYPYYSCLVKQEDGSLKIRRLAFKDDQVLEGDIDITQQINWAVYANWILRGGQIVNIEEIIEQFYDIRHVLAFDREQPLGKIVEAGIFEDYPDKFRQNALQALKSGVPRNRFLHNCLGLSEESFFILQKEGTIEEIANKLKEIGAKDGLILDNGASVFCWAWWLYPKGGFLFTAPDYRPKASAVLVFVLKGAAGTDLPSGSVSYSVI